MKVKELMKVVSSVCILTIEKDVTKNKKVKVYDDKDSYILSEEFVTERDYIVANVSSKGPFHLNIHIYNEEDPT